MDTAEETAPDERAKQIHARLAEIAPYPMTAEATTARSLARWLAVRAAVINCQQLSPDVPMSRSQVDLLTILFAAAHALRALCGAAPTEIGDRTAREIRDAWDGPPGVGEWLWDHLGSAACAEIGPLADELAALRKPAVGLLAHADPIRTALSMAVMNARSANHREAYMKALAALDGEQQKAVESS
jgi:hypothetical protein